MSTTLALPITSIDTTNAIYVSGTIDNSETKEAFTIIMIQNG